MVLFLLGLFDWMELGTLVYGRGVVVGRQCGDGSRDRRVLDKGKAARA